jgi:hypothetical protein
MCSEYAIPISVFTPCLLYLPTTNNTPNAYNNNIDANV